MFKRDVYDPHQMREDDQVDLLLDSCIEMVVDVHGSDVMDQLIYVDELIDFVFGKIVQRSL